MKLIGGLPRLSRSTRTTIEIIASACMVAYLVFYGSVNYTIANMMASTLGMIVIFLGLVAAIFYSTNPIFPIIYAIFAWYMVNKSIRMTKNVGLAALEFTPTTDSEEKRAQYMQKMTPPKEKTLEEEVVGKVAPKVGNQYIESAYKPVAEFTHNASMV